jgi:hypothetical protein
MNDGIGKLCKTIQQRAKDVNKSPLNLELGMIRPGFALRTDSFAADIPVNDYLVSRSLTIGKTGAILSGTTTIPEKMRSLKVGDRVLVAWVGSDAIIVDIVVPAKEATV